MLRIEGVSKHFGGVWALKDCFLDTKQWPVVGLIGPNGSGKTTLFHTITGFYKADRGKILFQEKKFRLSPFTRLPCGVLDGPFSFQEFLKASVCWTIF